MNCNIWSWPGEGGISTFTSFVSYLFYERSYFLHPLGIADVFFSWRVASGCWSLRRCAGSLDQAIFFGGALKDWSKQTFWCLMSSLTLRVLQLQVHYVQHGMVFSDALRAARALRIEKIAIAMVRSSQFIPALVIIHGLLCEIQMNWPSEL